MKRKILSVLSVFMSVLISTAVLAGCEKTPAEADGGSGESMSESGALYEFAASEEAAAQVLSMAEVLGGYDFESLSGIQSSWLLEQAI